jgi:hypothetical protein
VATVTCTTTADGITITFAPTMWGAVAMAYAESIAMQQLGGFVSFMGKATSQDGSVVLTFKRSGMVPTLANVAKQQ